ncbi:MAG TPA: hypothetical protein VLJ58_04905 [Ramlibacter sp.]|nr:hypothetical protein [Ramlibacter sp.]
MANKAKHHQRQRKEALRKLRRGEVGAKSSPPKAPKPSQWHGSPEASRKNLEAQDGHAHLRNKLREIAREKNEWAGIPMPLTGEQLVVEPTYPNADMLMAIGEREIADKDKGYTLRNRWYSLQRRGDIVLMNTPDGRIDWGLEPGFHSLPFALSTLGCSEAWGVEQESKAVQLLAGMVSHRQFKQYLLTGMFIESSKRSKVFYLFRRLRPTVAIVSQGATTRILCCLCMHPIAYYRQSWAGAMCPTDDVVAHLALMRGDEAMFWRRSTQHPSWRPEAGL